MHSAYFYDSDRTRSPLSRRASSIRFACVISVFVAANESLIAEIKGLGLRETTKQTGLDRKTIRAVLNGRKVKASTLTKVVIGIRQAQNTPIGTGS
jgi:predicted transcriptional regulator